MWKIKKKCHSGSQAPFQQIKPDTYLLSHICEVESLKIHTVKQSPSKEGSSENQEIPLILWKSKFQCRSHNGALRILRHMDPLHVSHASSLTLTHSMVQSPSWAANWFAASQEFPLISRNPKVHYRTHKRPPPVSILSHLDPVNATHPSSWRSILILSSHLRLGLPSGLFLSSLPTKSL